MFKINKNIKNGITSLGVLMLSLCFQNSAFAQLSGSYTIDASNPTGGTNYESFTDFADDINNNGVSGPVKVEVVANSGPYNEQVMFYEAAGADATNTITILGNGNTLTFDASYGSMYTLALYGADYFTISDLDIVCENTDYTWGIWFSDEADNNIIDGCTISCPNNSNPSWDYSAGIVFSSDSYYWGNGYNGSTNIIRNNQINGTSDGGFYYSVAEFQDYSYSENTYLNNATTDFYRAGFYHNSTIGNAYIGNKISRPNTVNSDYGNYGIQTEYCEDVLINGNSIFDMFTSSGYSQYYDFHAIEGYGFYGNTQIYNNLIYNNGMDGYAFGMFLTNVDGTLDIYHNTINYKTTSTNYPELHCILVDDYGNGSTMNIKNNVFDLEYTGTNAYVEAVSLYGYGGSTMNTSNNLWSMNIPNLKFDWLYYDNGSTWGGLSGVASMQNVGFESNSIEDFASYLNPSAADFSLANLGQDNRGEAVGISEDINGKSRNSNNPDIGAFELDIDVAVTAVTLPNASDCQDQERTVSITVKNNSSISVTNPLVEYRVDNGKPVIDTLKATLTPGGTANFSFNKKLKIPVGSHTLYGYLSYRFDGADDFAFTGKPAPVGSYVIAGSTFKGTLNSGNMGDPDVVANPDQVTYEIVPPTGYLNSEFGTKWAIQSLSFKATDGSNVPSGDTSTNLPGASNGKLTFKPSVGTTLDTFNTSYTVIGLGNGCVAPTISRQIYVAPRPKLGFTNNIACGGSKTLFTNTTSIAAGHFKATWSFGDGGSSDFIDPEHLYGSTGSYTVKLVAESDLGYKDSITKTVSVYNNPTTDFTFANACDNAPINFKAVASSPNSPGLTHVFDFGDGTTATGATVTHAYSAIGEYSVTITSTDGVGCVTKMSRKVLNAKKPSAGFTVNNGNSVCTFTDIDFKNTSVNSSAVGYEWSFGDGNISVSTDAKHTYVKDGQVDVKLIARNEEGCNDTVVKKITVNKGADIKFNFGGNCSGQLVKFTNSTVEPGATTYLWEFGDGSTSVDKNAVHEYGTVGEYIVKVTANSATCVSVKEQKIQVGENPIAYFSVNKENACTGEDLVISNGSYISTGTITYSWDLGNGTSTDLNPTLKYTNSGKYTIKLITSAGACKDTMTKDITVTATPDASFGQASEGLGLGGIVFTPGVANGSGTYTWDFGDNTTSNSKTSLTHRYPPVGLYKACLTRNDNGCIATTCEEVTVIAASVSKADANMFKIYPNPSKGEFVINASKKDLGTVQINVINAIGQIVYSANANLNNEYNLDLTNQAPGIYMVKIISGKEEFVNRVNIVR